jgi:hypothetical protein
MKPYRPSGIVPIPGLLTLLLVTAIAGLIVGGLLWFSDNRIGFYLIILFPIIAGYIVGTAGCRGIRIGKIRNPLVAGLIGVLGAVLVGGVYHYLGYELSFKEEVRQALIRQSPTASFSTEDVQKFTNEFVRSQVNDTGFVGFLKLEAKEGITITRSSSSSGIALKDALAWGYFVFEILIIAVLAAIMMSKAAREPFDERANTWFRDAMYLGGAEGDDGANLVSALKSGAFEQAGRLVRPESAELGAPRVELHARLSPDANASEAVLEVKSVTANKKNEESMRTLMVGMVTREELLRLKAVT